MPGEKRSILITGAFGQIGSALFGALEKKGHTVLATDIRKDLPPEQFLNILDTEGMEELIKTHEISEIYHLAALLSATSENYPDKAWQVNVEGTRNVLNIAKEYNCRVFLPSSIAVFGEEIESIPVEQHVPLIPTTIYGVSKVTGELLGKYYYERYGVDVRSIRYPGLISYETMPGGGTTDYAVEIYYKALEEGAYTCFLQPDTSLPMMYMSDAINATITLMEVPEESISVRTAYNLQSWSLSPSLLAESIKKYIENFNIYYQPDHRQDYADSWPSAVNDLRFRKDTGWKEKYDVDEMTREMLKEIKSKLHV